MENRSAVGRIIVLRTTDPFVRETTRLYPVLTMEGGTPLSQITAGGIMDGAGYLLYSSPQILA